MDVYAVMGYVINSMRLLGYERNDIEKVIRDIQTSMEIMTKEEAVEVYDEFRG